MATEVARIQFRRDTIADWLAVDPVLASGEVGYESDTGFYRVGDGSTVFSLLTAQGGYQPFKTVQLLTSDTALTTSNTAVGDIIEAGGYRYSVVASGGDIANMNGVQFKRLNPSYSGNNVDAFGVVDDGAISASPAYSPTGTDNAAKMQAAISSVQTNLDPIMAIKGNYYVNGSLNFNTGADGHKMAGFKIEGRARWNITKLRYDLGVFGDSLMLSPTSTISGLLKSTRVENLSIFGAIQTGALVSADIIKGGGFKYVSIVNAVMATPTGTPALVKVNAFYGGYTTGLRLMGHRNESSRWADAAISNASLYIGYGWGLHCDCSGLGSTGTLDYVNVSGLDRGVVIEADAASPTDFVEQVTFNNFQSQYCAIGFWGGNGANNVILNTPHFEFQTDADIKWAENAGILKVNGGKFSTSVRSGEYKRESAIVCGDPLAAKNSFELVKCTGSTFETNGNQNGAVMYYGGATAAPGVLILEDCIFTSGGARVLVDTTLGSVCDIWIKNGFDHHSQAPVTDTSRWICTFTRGADYTQHGTLVDASYLGRVEGVTTNMDALQGDLDLTGRKIIPYSILPNTGSIAVNITLSGSVWVGQFMKIYKRYSANNLSIVVPAGAVLIDRATGARTTGAATVVVTGVAMKTLEKIGPNEWVL